MPAYGTCVGSVVLGSPDNIGMVERCQDIDFILGLQIQSKSSEATRLLNNLAAASWNAIGVL